MDTGTTSAPATVEGANQDSNTDAEVNEEALVKQVSIHGDVKGGESIHFF